MKLEDIRQRIWKTNFKEARLLSARRRRLERYRASLTGKRSNFPMSQFVKILIGSRLGRARIGVELTERWWLENCWFNAVMQGVIMNGPERTWKQQFMKEMQGVFGRTISHPLIPELRFIPVKSYSPKPAKDGP